MPIKLYYLPVRGRGEPIRYLLHYAGIQFDDVHVTMEEWKKNQPMGSPTGLLPYVQLEDGRILSQSMSIGRYFANKYGLAGKDDFQKAQSDQYVDGVSDLFIPLRNVLGPLMREGMEKAMEAFKPFKVETLSKFLDRYSKFITDNKTGYLVGDGITWADLVVAEMMDKFLDWDATVLGDHPVMRKHHDMVYALPKIKEFAEARGKHPF